MVGRVVVGILAMLVASLGAIGGRSGIGTWLVGVIEPIGLIVSIFFGITPDIGTGFVLATVFVLRRLFIESCIVSFGFEIGGTVDCVIGA